MDKTPGMPRNHRNLLSLSAGALVLLALLLAGCSQPAPTAAPTATPAATVAAPLTPAATATSAPTEAPGPAGAALSLDDYLLQLNCESFGGGEEPETYGDFSASLGEVIDRMSSLAPPAEAAEWHNANVAAYEKFKAALDALPQDEEIDFSVFLVLAGDLEADEAEIESIVSRMSYDVVRQMAAAGCIDPEGVPDDHAQAHDVDGATIVTVGVPVEGIVDYEYDSDFFIFTAEEGQLYEVNVVLDTLPGAEVSLLRASREGGQVLARNDPLSSKFAWRASESGDYSVTVRGRDSGVGSYTLAVAVPDIVLLGTFSPGESVRVGDFEVAVTDAYPGEGSLTVRALVRNAGGNVLPEPPDCDVHATLEDGEGLRYGRSSCGWSGNFGDAFSPGAEADYFAAYEAPPENAVGLQWVFSDGETGAPFDLSPFLLFHRTVLEALVALYNATGGPNWTEKVGLYGADDKEGWLNDARLYDGYWYGVGVSDNRVIHLSLNDNGLSGSIPPELGNLTDLKILDLGDNRLSGPIPPELGDLINLEKLDLSDNQLSGPIPPELANLANLEWLILGGNRLSGCIPGDLHSRANVFADGLPPC